MRLATMNETRATIAINKLNMSWRHYLRLITVDETTVSSSRSLVFIFATSSFATRLRRFAASPSLVFFVFRHCITFPAMSLMFSLLSSSLYLFSTGSSRSPFAPFSALGVSALLISRGGHLAFSSFLFCIPGSASPLHSSPDPSSSDSLSRRGPFLLLSRAIREYEGRRARGTRLNVPHRN